MESREMEDRLRRRREQHRLRRERETDEDRDAKFSCSYNRKKEIHLIRCNYKAEKN